MTQTEILLSERCGTLGRAMLYTNDIDKNRVVRLRCVQTFSTHRLYDLFREIFLPHGYPDSVSEDYLEYQIWDTIQAFCSTITGTFTTQAILQGVGVGNAEASPFAAAITWIMKDGMGMIGRILFAWVKGNGLDSDCKKWRLFADMLNDAAMFIELLIPYFGNFFLQVLCVTTSMKAIVGVAGGATRASITQHQAIRGNMADVSAKDGSQETFVNLIASLAGIFLLAMFSESRYRWVIFALFACIHLLANYFAVCCINIPHVNNCRLIMILRTYLRYNAVPSPQVVNRKEPVIVGFGPNIKDVCGFDIKIGQPLNNLPSIIKPADLQMLIRDYGNAKYLLVPNVTKRVIYIALEQGETAEDVISAYFHAVLLGIATCHYNEIEVNLNFRRHLHRMPPISRLYSTMKSVTRNREVQANLPFHDRKVLNDYIYQEIAMFFTALKINGWNISNHAMEMGQWRADWKTLPQFSKDLSNESKSHKKSD